MYKIIFYVPLEQAEQVKNAVFAAGAGRIGDYSCCAWQCVGEGQFKPLVGSNAFIGEINKLKKVTELKVELVCDSINIKAAIEALKQSHPYEEPAYQVIRCEDI